MSRKRSKEPGWLVPAIILSGTVAFFLSKSAFGATKPTSKGNVQTATVGDRVYSITRLGQGNYIVSLISTGGVLETSPVNFVFSQTEQLGAIGDERKLAQLKTDMQFFNVDFHS